MAGNGAHIELQQQEGAPAIAGASSRPTTSLPAATSGAAVSLSGLGANVAANTIDGLGHRRHRARQRSGRRRNAGDREHHRQQRRRRHHREGRCRRDRRSTTTTSPTTASGSATSRAPAPSMRPTTGGTRRPGRAACSPASAIASSGSRAGADDDVHRVPLQAVPAGLPERPGRVQHRDGRAAPARAGTQARPRSVRRATSSSSRSDHLDVDRRTATRPRQHRRQPGDLPAQPPRPKKKLTGVCLGGLLPCDFDDRRRVRRVQRQPGLPRRSRRRSDRPQRRVRDRHAAERRTPTRMATSGAAADAAAASTSSSPPTANCSAATPMARARSSAGAARRFEKDSRR